MNMRFLLIIAISVIVGAPCAISSQHLPSEDKAASRIRQQMERLRRAELAYDTSAAASLLSDNFELSAADGNVYDKHAFLNIVGDRSNPLEIFEFGEVTIRVDKYSAIAIVRLHEKGMLSGKAYELNGRSMFVWTLHGKNWICLGAHD